jgi:hypothetical protein
LPDERGRGFQFVDKQVRRGGSMRQAAYGKPAVEESRTARRTSFDEAVATVKEAVAVF